MTTTATKTSKGYRTSFGLISDAQAELLRNASTGTLWSMSRSRRASAVKLHALGLIDAPEFGAKITDAGRVAQVELFGVLPAVGTRVARRFDGKVGVVVIAEFAALEVRFDDGGSAFGFVGAFIPVNTAAEVIANSEVPVTTRTEYVPSGHFTAVVNFRGWELEFLFPGDAWNMSPEAVALGHVTHDPNRYQGEYRAVASDGNVVGTYPFRAAALRALRVYHLPAGFRESAAG